MVAEDKDLFPKTSIQGQVNAANGTSMPMVCKGKMNVEAIPKQGKSSKGASSSPLCLSQMTHYKGNVSVCMACPCHNNATNSWWGGKLCIWLVGMWEVAKQ